MINIRSLLLFSVLFVVSLGACRSGGPTGGNPFDDDGGGGSCDNVFDDPLINITEAVDSESGEPIPEFFMEEIRVGGLLLADSASLAQPTDEHYGIMPIDGGLRCTVPCGFGIIEGNWRLAVQPGDFEADTIEIAASYGDVSAGCPIRHRNGVSVTVELDPAG